MKKRLLSILLVFTMVLSLISTMGISASAGTQEATEGWTSIGTCEYQITGEGNNQTLTIRPIGNGESGTLSKDGSGNDIWPWTDKDNITKSKITKVEFMPGVKAGDDISYIFCNFAKLTSIDFNDFDTSNVENMNEMFQKCESLTSLNLSNFDTSNVKYMIAMFDGCTKLNALDISNFDTSNALDMYAMFKGCTSLVELDLSNFITTKLGQTE